MESGRDIPWAKATEEYKPYSRLLFLKKCLKFVLIFEENILKDVNFRWGYWDAFDAICVYFGVPSGATLRGVTVRGAASSPAASKFRISRSYRLLRLFRYRSKISK